MDSGAKPQKTIEDAVKNLKIDPPSKASEATLSGPKDGSPSDATSCISSGDATASSIKESELDQEALMGDQGMYYYGYCYPGFNGSCGEWDDQSYYLATDNMEVQPQVIQGDNGTLMYYLPGYSPGYMPYSPVLPGAVVGVEGQYLGQQSYYPSPILQQPLASPGFVPQSVAYGPELVPAYPWDSSFLFADGFQGYGLGGYPTTPTPQSSFSSRSHTLPSSKTSTSSKSTSSETKGSSLASDVTPTLAGPKQSVKPLNKGAAAVYSKGYLPINKFPTYANQGKGGLLYPNSHINIKDNGRSWAGSEKVKARNKLNGPGDIDLLNEQNRGPRTNSINNASISGVDLVGSLDAGKNDNSSNSVATVRKDMHNLSDFPTKYDHALFFVIKSYSEDDVHKSIKYNVWASTPNGNKRLDNAFQVAQDKLAENGSRCPVFLFFSVNASGQFCGVAEMTGPVDFSKNMDFWQQDKWNGFFPVKWHIIKDIPNPQFRHIILENNENKPVTNSRDTQEVKFSQGTEMLNIFKNYSSKTSILDDFNFYESRQKAMQHKRSKPPPLRFDHLQPKIDEFSALKQGDLKFIVSTLQSVELEAVKAKDELSTMVAATE